MLNNVLIVDDHPSVREGLGALLLKNRVAEIITEAGNVKDAYSKALSIKPDLVLMDISLHGLSGIELSKKLIK